MTWRKWSTSGVAWVVKWHQNNVQDACMHVQVHITSSHHITSLHLTPLPPTLLLSPKHAPLLPLVTCNVVTFCSCAFPTRTASASAPRRCFKQTDFSSSKTSRWSLTSAFSFCASDSCACSKVSFCSYCLTMRALSVVVFFFSLWVWWVVISGWWVVSGV